MEESKRFSDVLAERFSPRKIDIIKTVEGRILTLLDGVISDKEQRESAKSLARQTITTPLYEDFGYLESFILTYVYEFLHKGDVNSAESRPWYHLKNRSMMVEVDVEEDVKRLEAK